MAESTDFEYDVALSFAGEDRDYVQQVAEALREKGVRVFYDKYEQAALWGKDLYAFLGDVYQRKARLCLMFVSSSYALKAWTSHERKAAQARALIEATEYILPVRLDDSEVPGLNSTVGYVAAKEYTPESLAALVSEKLRQIARERTKRPRVGLFVDVQSIFPLINSQDWGCTSEKLRSYALRFGDLECCCAALNARTKKDARLAELLMASHFFVISSDGPYEFALLDCIAREAAERSLKTCIIVTGDGDFYSNVVALLERGRTVRLMASPRHLNARFRELLSEREELRGKGRPNSEFYIDTLEQVLLSQAHNPSFNRTDTALSCGTAG
jgi:hypothetical protein